MRIAIIGTGNVGAALARTLSSAGHDLVVTSTSPDEAQALASEVGGKSASSNSEAVQAAEVIILAVPYGAVEPIIEEVGDALDGKVLIDVTNRMGGDNPGTVVDGTSNAEQIQARAPEARVVKGLQHRSRRASGRPRGQRDRDWTGMSRPPTAPRRRPSSRSCDPPGCAPSTPAHWRLRGYSRRWGLSTST
jgi:ketopantoate reductase